MVKYEKGVARNFSGAFRRRRLLRLQILPDIFLSRNHFPCTHDSVSLLPRRSGGGGQSQKDDSLAADREIAAERQLQAAVGAAYLYHRKRDRR